jgi:hypothetical protein
MMRRALVLGLACSAVVLVPTVAWAGMPTPVLTEWATMRLSAISFFTVGMLVSALVVKLLWNSLAKDFTKLPRLGYLRSLALVVLWGFLFLFVLTMIAGARELMTPEAWQLRGLTYKVVGRDKQNAPAEDESPDSLDLRRGRLEGLKLSLWDYALKHDGRFPGSLEEPGFDGWKHDVVGVPGLLYGYVPGKTAQGPGELLAFEPNVFGDSRLVLHTDGTMAVVSGEEIRRLLAGKEEGEEKAADEVGVDRGQRGAS